MKNQKQKTSKKVYQAPKGMHDIFPPLIFYYEKLREICATEGNFYGYKQIELPILENKEVFEKGVGSNTDMIEKEMYVLKTKGGDELALRPEGTAGAARAYIQNGFNSLPQPVKLWYFGPMFRHENPQAGRYRQFWQAGFEYFSAADPAADAELIYFADSLLRNFKLKNIFFEINSIGCNVCRPKYKKALKSYYRSRVKNLCSDCKARYINNPLRLLDCKKESCLVYKKNAPQIVDYLCKNCKTHFQEVLEYLDNFKISYVLNPYLVRGLDYYNRTVFEIALSEKKLETEEDINATLALGGGGRYDYLVKYLGGEDTPALGFALGIDRIVEVLAALKTWEFKDKPDVFIAQIGESAKNVFFELLEKFRKSNIKVSFDLSRNSLKAQLGTADKLGVKVVIILGQQEVLTKTLVLRDMTEGTQEVININKVIEKVKEKLHAL